MTSFLKPAIKRRSDYTGEVVSGPISTDAQTALEADPLAATGQADPSLLLDAPGLPLQEVENPYKRQSYNRKESGFYRGFLGGLMRAVSRRLLPAPKTPEEIALLDEKKRRELLEKALRADALADVRNIRACLNNLAICSYTTEDGRKKVLKPVKFDDVLVEPDAVHIHIARSLPWGVTIAQLTDPCTLDNLSHSVGHAIACKYTPENGIWYTVERASGRAGIPNHVNYTEMIERMPASASPLAIPVGYATNKRPVYEDLGRMPHMLVGGTTGGGKTNFLHSLICTLVQRNVPERLRLVLVDLKGGMAFARYEGMPHLMVDPTFNPTGIIEDRSAVGPLMDWLISEGERRIKIMRENKAEDIGHYNRNRKTRMPFVVVVIDEWADMLMIEKIDAENSLINIISRMRSVGIHVVLATQNPTSKVIDGKIKVNMPCRVAFSVPNLHGSMAIIDDGSAAGLQPVGRCILQFRQQSQIQTPYIPVELVDKIVAAATSGDFGELKVKIHDVTPREIMEWALHDNNGWLTQRDLLRQFSGRSISDHELRDMVASWDGQVYTIESSDYQVINSPDRRGRRLVAITEKPEPVQAPKYHKGEELLSASLGKAVKIVTSIESPDCREYEVNDGSLIAKIVPEDDLYPGAEQ